MATLYGVNRTLANTPTSDNITDAGLLAGKVRAMVDTYEASAAAVADVIQMGKALPIGARVIEVILQTDALGGSVTLAVGDLEDGDRYITATACNTANQVTRMNAIGGRGYEVDETTASTSDRQITITVAGAAATGTIELIVLYVGNE